MDGGGVQIQARPVDVAGRDQPGLEPQRSSGDKDSSAVSSLTNSPKKQHHGDQLVTCNHDDYESVLETIDSCVGCVEGVDRQHRFEEGLNQQSLHQRQVAEEHGLSQAEAAMIRMQISSENGGGITKMIGSTLPDIDILNFLGCEELNDPACGGLVSPTDTTIEDSGDRLLDTDHSSRSLVDVAALEDPSIRAKPLTKLQCAICFDEAGIEGDDSGENVVSNRIRFVYFPCCEPADDDSSHHSANAMNVCTSCILVLTTATTDGSSRVGRCPRCRGWIAASTLHSPNVGLTIRTLEGCEGQCGVCMEAHKPLVEQNPPTCDACFLGKRCPLAYECKDCHSVQTIHHPIYRYQETADSFGNKTWECEGKCKKPTNWKICKDQLSLIPAGDVPATWGDDCLQLARARVKEARRGIAQFDLFGKQHGHGANDEGCTIL